jgi:transposase
LVEFGYNRDGKKNHEQIVIGLICNKEGCPVAIEVYPGNTKDETTVVNKINQIKEKYNIKQLIFVGDRGMVTKSNLEKLKTKKDLLTISALTRPEIFTLLNHNIINPSLFDEREIHEVIDPNNPSKRYCLCKNPFQAKKDQETRQRLIKITSDNLTKIQNYQRSTTTPILGARIGKIMAKYKMTKYISWNIIPDLSKDNSKNHKISFEIDQEAINRAEILDGCYIISTNVNQEVMATNEVVASYKKLQLVEQAFRNLKTVQLELRPIFHKKDDRIRAHVFLCMLAYHVQWHMNKKLHKLFKEDKKGKDRHWTFNNVIATLKQITWNKTQAQGIVFYRNSELTENQKKIIDYLGIKL